MPVLAVSLEDRKKFYDALKADKSGYRDDLKTAVAYADDTNDSKFLKLYTELGSVGILRMGIDGLLKPRYKLTEFGKEQIESFTMLYDL